MILGRIWADPDGSGPVLVGSGPVRSGLVWFKPEPVPLSRLSLRTGATTPAESTQLGVVVFDFWRRSTGGGGSAARVKRAVESPRLDQAIVKTGKAAQGRVQGLFLAALDRGGGGLRRA